MRDLETRKRLKKCLIVKSDEKISKEVHIVGTLVKIFETTHRKTLRNRQYFFQQDGATSHTANTFRLWY